MICPACALAADTGNMKLHLDCNNVNIRSVGFQVPNACNCAHMEVPHDQRSTASEIQQSTS